MVTQLPGDVVEFSFFRPRVRQVAIAGDFNGWQPCFRMIRQPEGWWRCRMTLAPGVYQFRYSADGEWYNDYAAFGLEHGPHGLNSVVVVEPSPPAERDAEPAIAAA